MKIMPAMGEDYIRRENFPEWRTGQNGRCEVLSRWIPSLTLGPPVKECFEELKKAFAPDVIFTHCRHDLHQDHRLGCELTWNTFRDHLILEYQIPKYDADLRSPNFFGPLSDTQARKKVNSLIRYFNTQQNKQWFSEELFYGLMRLRATEVASPARYAEAFCCRKTLLGAVN